MALLAATAVTLLLGGAASCASDGTPVEAAPEPTTAQSSETTAPNLRSVDWANRAYEVCDQSAQLADGDWQSPDGTVGISLDGVLYGDADGDGREDAVVKLSCYPIGGNAYPAPVNLVFTLGPDGPAQLGEGFHGGEPTIVEGGVQTIDPVWADGDPRSTPSGSVTTIWRFEDGAWVSTVTTPPSTTNTTTTTTTTIAPTPAASDLGALPAIDGYGPVGSGCTPGPGALPDGWWFGEAPVPPRAGASFQFDLACFEWVEMADELHGHDDVVVTNDNPTLRTVTVAADVERACSDIISGSEQACADDGDPPSWWVRIEGGAATKIVSQLWWE